jgi:GT2 family glycosyltransferase
VHAAGKGLSRARNLGAAAVWARVLVFVDDDVLVTRGWLEALLVSVSGSERDVGTGRVLLGEPESPDAFQVAQRTESAPAVFSQPGRRDVLAGGNMAIHRAAFEAIGRFDERLGAGTRLPGAEDNDLGFRLLEAGYRIMFVPDALIYHRQWRPQREYLHVRFGYGAGQGAFYAKHARRRDGHMLKRAAWHVGHYLVRLPWRLVAAPRRAAGDVAFLGGLAVGASRWIRDGRDSPMNVR